MPVKHRGYGAYISCDGDELEAYKVKVESSALVSCYVASEAGKEFRVHWVDSKPPSHLSVEIRMDGSRMGVLSHTKQSSKTSNGGFRVAIDAHCPYQFAPLETADNDDLPSAYSDDLGAIEVRLRRVRDFISVPFVPKATPTKPTPVKANERKRRGAGPAHCVVLGNTRDVNTQSTILKPLLIDDKPYVTFRFLYRPIAFLRAKGIIPVFRPSSPVSVVSSTPSSTAGRRRRRSPSELSYADEDSPAPYKRQRTTFEDECDDDGSVPPDETDDNKENVTEIHLSSQNNFAIPGNLERPVHVKREPSVKRWPSPVSVSRDPSVKREETPVVEVRISSKDNYASQRQTTPFPVKQEPLIKQEPGFDPLLGIKQESSQPVVKRKLEKSIKPEPVDDYRPNVEGSLEPNVVKREDDSPMFAEDADYVEDDPVVEVHVSSINRHVVFGKQPRMRAASIKTEPRDADVMECIIV